MHAPIFFRLFPPPRLLAMRHIGLDISDDAVHCLEYALTTKGWVIKNHTDFNLSVGMVSGGDIKDESAFVSMLLEKAKAKDWSHVKVSLPEEKTYLFQIDVPSADMNTIEQNIESKLEENVPLSAADAVFYFDLLPMSVTGGSKRASVSVVSREYVERYVSVLHRAGLFPVAFEVVPKSLARAIVPSGTDHTQLMIHIMNSKVGLYIISGGVVSFTSTIGLNSPANDQSSRAAYVQALSKEIDRIHSYWASRAGGRAAISRILLVGRGAADFEHTIGNLITSQAIPIEVAHVWQNVFDIDRYIPDIAHDQSLEYAVAAGLAMPA